MGEFPSTRCDDGSLLDYMKPCPPIAGNAYLMTPALYLVSVSRQTYGFGVAYHLTGDPKYLGYKSGNRLHPPECDRPHRRDVHHEGPLRRAMGP